MPRNKTTRARLVDKLRMELFDALGHQCAEAGDDCDGPLQIDHPYGRDWVPRRTNIYNRWLRYRREHQQGLIRLLCRHHNETLHPCRADTHHHYQPLTNQPF